MFCYNKFWSYLHICSLLKAFCFMESLKSCLLPLLSNLYCTSIKGEGHSIVKASLETNFLGYNAL